jgi:hypothetical protein
VRGRVVQTWAGGGVEVLLVGDEGVEDGGNHKGVYVGVGVLSSLSVFRLLLLSSAGLASSIESGENLLVLVLVLSTS